MTPKTFIFLGSSGSGKGTQTKNIRNFLESRGETQNIVELGMGDIFRIFWKDSSLTADLSRVILERGGLQPCFLQIYLWTQFFIENLSEDTHLLIDGTPRRIEDARALDSAFRFYSRSKPVVVYLKVSREWAKERLLERAQSSESHELLGADSLRVLEDSDLEKIESRLDWFEESALPAIDFFREKHEYTFIEVNGEQSIEAVKEEIIRQAFTM